MGVVFVYIRCNLNYKICKDLSSDKLEYLTVEILNLELDHY